MPRPRKDGKPARQANKRKLTDLYVQNLQRNPPAHSLLTWDTDEKRLALLVRPSGHASYKVIYSFHGRPRWYTIGDHDDISLADARKEAQKIKYQVRIEGKDPQAEKKAKRSLGTFEELATRYVEERAKKKNKSWRQADALVKKHLLPRWGKMPAHTISRDDVKRTIRQIKAPIVANQTLAAASAIFSWAIDQEIDDIKENPCRRVDRNKTKSRERVLANSEVPKFWSAFDSAGLIKSAALKMILLTGQRPGEVCHMRHEHIVDGWWQMPGAPMPDLDWPGTKNGENHRIWLPAAAWELIRQVNGGDEVKDGFVFAASRGRPVARLEDAMKAIWTELGVERATPHDLRRTHGTKIAALGFGRDAMNRIQNHKEGGIASVYDRHGYADEIKKIMETVAAAFMSLVQRTETDNVVAFAREEKATR